MNHILPKQYNEVFQVLHDSAPCVPYDELRQIILDDLKVDASLIFKEFDEEPVASASIAQVSLFVYLFFTRAPFVYYTEIRNENIGA